MTTWGHVDKAYAHLIHEAYFYIFALVCVWIISLYAYLDRYPIFSFQEVPMKYMFELLFPCLVAAIIAISVKASVNASTGEMHALGVSKSMAFSKSIWAIYFPSDIDAIFPTHVYIDIKPFLFPFILSLIHTLFGLHDGNVFILNFILMAFCLCAVFICTRLYSGRILACAATLFLASCPVFSFCGRSGSNDMMATLLIGIVFVILYSFMKNRRTEEFTLLWMTLLMLSSVREESPFYFIFVMTLLFALGYVNRNHIKDSLPIIGWTPLLVLPLVWQRMIHDKTSFGAMNNDPLFSWSHFKDNAPLFIRSQFDFGFQLPYPNVLHIVGFLIFSFLLIDVFIRKRSFSTISQKHFIVIVYTCLLFHLILMLSFWWPGTYTNVVSIRYFLPFTIALALSPIFMTFTREKFMKNWPPWLLGASFCTFFLYHPIAVEGSFLLRHPINIDSEFEFDVLKNQEDKRILIIANFPWRFTTLGWKALDFDSANNSIPAIQSAISHYTLRDILVMQHMRYDTDLPVPSESLNPTFILEPLFKYQIASHEYLRISRLKSIETKEMGHQGERQE